MYSVVREQRRIDTSAGVFEEACSVVTVDFAEKRIRDGECQMTSSDHVARGKKKTEVLKDHGDRRAVPASSIMMGVLGLDNSVFKPAKRL